VSTWLEELTQNGRRLSRSFQNSCAYGECVIICFMNIVHLEHQNSNYRLLV